MKYEWSRVEMYQIIRKSGQENIRVCHNFLFFKYDYHFAETESQNLGRSCACWWGWVVAASATQYTITDEVGETLTPLGIVQDAGLRLHSLNHARCRRPHDRPSCRTRDGDLQVQALRPVSSPQPSRQTATREVHPGTFYINIYNCYQLGKTSIIVVRIQILFRLVLFLVSFPGWKIHSKCFKQTNVSKQIYRKYTLN